MLYDADYYNELRAETKAYQEFVKEEKKRILSIRDYDRKVREWRKLFPKLPQTSNETVY